MVAPTVATLTMAALLPTAMLDGYACHGYTCHGYAPHGCLVRVRVRVRANPNPNPNPYQLEGGEWSCSRSTTYSPSAITRCLIALKRSCAFCAVSDWLRSARFC